jgi:hypothetical protein
VHLFPLGKGCAEIAGAQGYGIGDIGFDGGNADCREHRKCDQGSAPGKGVDRAGGNGRTSYQDKLERTHHLFWKDKLLFLEQCNPNT